MSCVGSCSTRSSPVSRPDSASDKITQNCGCPVFSKALIHSGGHGNRQARPNSKSRFGAGFLGEGVDVVGVAGPDGPGAAGATAPGPAPAAVPQAQRAAAYLATARLRRCHEAAQSVAFVLPPAQPRPEPATGHAYLTARTPDQASTWRTPAGGEVNVSSVLHGHLHPARSAMSS